MRKTLLMTVGLPRSGKSTWAHNQDLPIVNPDSIRLAMHGERYIQLTEPYVWAIAETMVRSLFLAGHDEVILDATNITQGRRNKWKTPDWINKFVVFNTSKEECIRRSQILKDEYIIPVIERMASEFQPLTPEEQAFIYETVGATCPPFKDSEAHIVGFPTSGQVSCPTLELTSQR